jgi:hypothetical protein
VLFLTVATVYLAWRAPGDLVWDDSPTVANNHLTPTRMPQVCFGDADFWGAMAREDFGAFHPDGYRPLSWMMRRLGVACEAATPWATAIFLVLNAVVAGLLAVAAYRLARRFTRTETAALFAVFLLLASTPILTGFLVLFVGIQALVPLAICAALNCYFASLASPRPRLCLFFMAALLLIAPLYREFAGIVPLLVLFLEARQGRRRFCVIGLAVLTFFLAVYPTLIPHLLFFPNLKVARIFELGVLGGKTHVGIDDSGSLLKQSTQMIGNLKWRVGLDLLAVLPPTVFLLALCGWIAAARRRKRPALPWGQAAFLGCFFLLSFLPFLKVFKEQVHLAYCLVPASIMLAASVEALWLDGVADRQVARLVVTGLLLLIVADHALNLFTVRGATQTCYAAIRDLATVCEREIPERSIILSNAHHAADVQWDCQGRFDLMYTVMTSDRRDLLIDSPKVLNELLRGAHDRRVFCLDVRLPRLRGQYGGDRANWIVRNRPVELLDLGRIGHVSYRYPVVDPLKLLVPISHMSWPCSPDLQFDYYRGPALGGPSWLREVAVSYYLYELDRQDPLPEKTLPTISGSE